MPLISLRHPDEITVSVERAVLDRVIAHRLSLTAANHLGDNIDSMEITLTLPVTIDGTEYECRDIRLQTSDMLQTELLIGRVDVDIDSDEHHCHCLVFGLQKSDPDEDWQVSSLVVKAAGETSADSDDILEDGFLQKKPSEQLQLLGL